MACSARVIFVVCLVLVAGEDKVEREENGVQNGIKKHSKRMIVTDKLVDSDAVTKDENVGEVTVTQDTNKHNDSSTKPPFKVDPHPVSHKVNSKGPRLHLHPMYYSKKAVFPYTRYEGSHYLKPVPFAYYKPKRVHPSYKIPYERHYSNPEAKHYPVYYEKRVPYPVVKVVPYPVKSSDKSYLHHFPTHHYPEKKNPSKVTGPPKHSHHYTDNSPHHDEKTASYVKNPEVTVEKPNSQEYSTPVSHEESNSDWVPKPVSHSQEHYSQVYPSEHHADVPQRYPSEYHTNVPSERYPSEYHANVPSQRYPSEHYADASSQTYPEYYAGVSSQRYPSEHNFNVPSQKGQSSEQQGSYHTEVHHPEPSGSAFSSFYHIPATHHETDGLHSSSESWTSGSSLNQETSSTNLEYPHLPVDQNFKSPEFPSNADFHYHISNTENHDPNNIFGTKTTFSRPSENTFNTQFDSFSPFEGQGQHFFSQQHHSDVSPATSHPNSLDVHHTPTESFMSNSKSKHHYFSSSLHKNIMEKFKAPFPEMNDENDDRPKSFVEKDFHGYYTSRIIH